MRRTLLITLLIFSLALLALIPWRAAQADTIMVTTILDSGAGSLRAAISEANDRPGPDTIIFHADTNTHPFILTGSFGEDLNDSGDLDILAGGDLTITGNGPTNTIIDGGVDNDRVFHVCPGGCTQTVTISGLTIQNGLAIVGGAGIRNAADSLIVDNCVIRDSIAINGGGIANLGTLIIQNGTIIGGAGAGNQAYESNGGGIYNHSGSTTIDDSTVSDNIAGNNGGGIFNYDGGVVTVNGSTVSANSATIDGGGIYNRSTLLIQNGSTIGGSSAGNSADQDGGGIHNYGTGTVTVDDSTISGNSAVFDGGGINNNATLNVQNGSTISANTTSGDGGGIYNDSSGTTTVDNSTVSANSVPVDGGGIYNYAILNVQNGSTIGGPGTGNVASRGGGIYNESPGTVTVDGSTVSDNSVTIDGGGIYNHALLNVQNDSTIGGASAGNTADRNGGGIYIYDGDTTVDGSTVSANTASYNGGGIFNNATLNVQSGSTIGGAGAGNSAHLGGGIYNLYDGNSTVDSSTVSANSANYGGGIFNYAALIIQNSSMIGGPGAGNTASDSGGGIYNEGGTTVDSSTVSANSANYGGGISNYEGSTTVDSSTVSANSATIDGGGIYNEYYGTLNILNGSTIGGGGASNTANNYGGGIFNWDYGVTTATGSRILNNTANTNGGGVYIGIDAGATSMTGSCIVGNSDWSFNNSQLDEQIATGNWWGAPTGPNTAGADSVLGDVDVSGYLTTPILDCISDLQADKSNDTGGNGTVGVPFNWTVTIANTGLVDATFEGGQTILTDNLPAGPTYDAPVVANVVSVANDANIHCSLASNTVSCAAAGGSVTLGAETGKFDVTNSVTPSAAVTLVNPTGICIVDPDGYMTEGNEGNNNCPVDVVNISPQAIYLPLVVR